MVAEHCIIPFAPVVYRMFLQVELAVLLGADRDRTEKEMRAALEFEKQLANVS